MNSLLRPFLGRALPGALALTIAPAASALDSGCAPAGMRAPHLSLMPVVGSGDELRLQADPALAGGGAVLFLEDPHGSILPPGPCVGGLIGHLWLPVALDADARATWVLPAGSLHRVVSARAFAWPAGGGWPDAHRSGSLALPPANELTPEPWTDLVLTEFLKDPTAVSDTKGEWIEVFNAGSAPVDLEGWTLADLGTDQTQLDAGGAGIVVPPGGRVVLGREADPNLNGGITVDAVYAGLTLSNGADEIVLIRPDGLVVDEVVYDDGVNWPDDAGRSATLDPSRHDAQQNDDGGSWCASQTPIPGSVDHGTPGVANETCG